MFSTRRYTTDDWCYAFDYSNSCALNAIQISTYILFSIKQTPKMLDMDLSCIGLHGFRYFLDEFKNNTVSFKQNSKYNFQIPL